MPLRPETQAVLDHWVQDTLRRQYEATLREAVPDELLKLIAAAD